MCNNLVKTLTLAISAIFISANIQAQDADLVKQGEYLAQAGDCTACHTTNDDKKYAGGYVFDMPMGKIISSNITSSKEFGIGNWSETEFAKAVREGITPNGRHLYPAMPYVSYAKITDPDIKALYAYFMQTTPVNALPDEKTELKFPFNLPGVMFVWDSLYAKNKPFTPDANLNEEQNRGKYLVDGLGHCGDCHTPRNAMMAVDDSKYLAGTDVDGWRSSNITSDANSGIGGWTNEELVTYLKTGNTPGKAQAAGPMADAVAHSLRFLSEEDLSAIAAYLKVVPAISDGAKQPAYSVTTAKPIPVQSYENSYSAQGDQGHRDLSTTDGATLYYNNCAACHGIDGQGSLGDNNTAGIPFPSLTANTAVGDKNPTNLVKVIIDGIERQGNDGTIAVMPAFGIDNQRIHDWLNEEQIASVANYVSEQFGHGNPNLTAADIKKIQEGPKPSALIRNAATLAYIGFAVAAIVLLLIIFLIIKAFRKKV